MVPNLTTNKFFKLDVSFFSDLCISICSFTTLSEGKLLKKIKYTKVYDNADKNKLDILKDNKGKSGIYLWENKENGKFYIGSSLDLKRRLMCYYNINYLAKFSTSYINNALLKEGYSAFRFYIIEYCNKKDLIKREQYYFYLLKPTYNICKFFFRETSYWRV